MGGGANVLDEGEKCLPFGRPRLRANGRYSSTKEVWDLPSLSAQPLSSCAKPDSLGISYRYVFSVGYSYTTEMTAITDVNETPTQ